MSSVSRPRPCIITTTPRLASTGLPLVATGRPVCGFVISLQAPGASWNQARAGDRGARPLQRPVDGVRVTAHLPYRFLLHSYDDEAAPPVASLGTSIGSSWDTSSSRRSSSQGGSIM